MALKCRAYAPALQAVKQKRSKDKDKQGALYCICMHEGKKVKASWAQLDKSMFRIIEPAEPTRKHR